MEISEEVKATEEEQKLQKYTEDSFDNIREVGAGSFGRVFLVKHKITKKEYALKELSKQKL